MLYILIGSILLMVIWFFFSVNLAKRRKKRLQDSPKKSPVNVSDDFKQNIGQILKFSSKNKIVKPTVMQWLTQYENISDLQIRLLQTENPRPNTDTKKDFAHQMIEKQKQEIEKKAIELLVALQNKDKKKIREVCNPTLEKAEAVQRAMQQDTRKP